MLIAREMHLYMYQVVLTNRSCIPERDCLISRASGQHVGVGQKLDTVDRVSMTAEAQHTDTTEIMQVGIKSVTCSIKYMHSVHTC